MRARSRMSPTMSCSSPRAVSLHVRGAPTFLHSRTESRIGAVLAWIYRSGMWAPFPAALAMLLMSA